MTSPQRQRQRRPASSGPDPASRGFILVIVAVVLGAILLAAGGTVGFDQDDESIDIGAGGDATTETSEAPASTTTSAPVTVAPADVAVVVANGAGISGLAGDTTDFLATQGYTNSTATDAPADVAQSVVYFAPGFESNAQAMADMLGLPAQQVQALPPEPVANDQPAGAAIVLVIAADVEAVVTGGGAATDPATTDPATTGSSTTTAPA